MTSTILGTHRDKKYVVMFFLDYELLCVKDARSHFRFTQEILQSSLIWSSDNKESSNKTFKNTQSSVLKVTVENKNYPESTGFRQFFFNQLSRSLRSPVFICCTVKIPFDLWALGGRFGNHSRFFPWLFLETCKLKTAKKLGCQKLLSRNQKLSKKKSRGKKWNFSPGAHKLRLWSTKNLRP